MRKLHWVEAWVGLIVILGCASLAVGSVSKKIDPVQNKERFINHLLKRMTLEEKVGQLTQFTAEMDRTGTALNPDYRKDLAHGKVGSILNAYTPAFTRQLQKIAVEETRLGIPLLFAYDVIHGHRTIFPIPLGESNSWDLPLMEQTARIAAREASADGLSWTYAPMVDIARDPRWGRISEGAGEDPWLGSAVARAKVRGYQGKTLSDPETVLATAKHFALYGAVQAGREYQAVDMSPRAMLETYLPPYRAAIQEGVASVMSAFNEINGTPATANSWLLTDLLRKEWGFKGIVVTDYTAIHELTFHGVATDDKKAAELAFLAGNDIDMQSGAFVQHLPQLVREHKVSSQQIDRSVRRILSVKYDLGLFRDPYRQVTEERAKQVLLHPEHLDVARKMARESITLLKNEGSLLPLKPGAQVALIGPLAQSKKDLVGNWSAAADWSRAVTVADGLREKSAKDIQFRFEKGANLVEDRELLKKLNDHGEQIELDRRPPSEMISDAVRLAKDSDVVVAVLGESRSMSGEAGSRADIGLPENQLDLLKALVKTKKPVVLVLMNGRPLALEWEAQNVQAIVETWFLGHEAGHAIADVLVGDYNPSGRLTTSFPRRLGQVPIYYAEKNTGRPMAPDNWYSSRYLDVSNEPLFPFGFGMSYSKISYGDLKVDRDRVPLRDRSGQIRAKLSVSNQSPRAAVEVVQLYLRNVVASVTRPLRELKGFQRLELAPGETRLIEFVIPIRDFEFYNQKLQKVLEPGEVRVMVGPNSSELREVRVEITR